jgi:SAM-dependent methyltransferase
MQNQSHKTAIRRRAISCPTKYLYNKGLLVGKILDYGCGRGDDIQRLNELHVKADKYDPYWFPFAINAYSYDVIICNYVLNVIPEEDERQAVIDTIKVLLKDGGVAYISIRNDVRELRGWTSKGTWQGLIDLDLPIFHKSSNYIMYCIKKDKK